ncbi:MAG: VWA domain-containing protein [Spirochaetales bacterium]|nr:VWA domain-containing protein [Spirochaetales bacterium]
MKRIYRYAFFVTLGVFVITILLLFADFTTARADIEAGIAAGHDGPAIQLAVLLDTSGSMSGLIDQAKACLWNIVNELSETQKDGKTPALYVSLYEYGKQSISTWEGHIRQIVPLSRDLDHIYEELFRLTTNGGDEYCGMVIERALAELPWSDNDDDLKLIFIAGNEPFTQGSVDYKSACATASERGITVNTIHCGNREEGIREFWYDGAVRGGGQYMTIDHNQVVVAIDAPQDEEIARLNEALNNTYIPYGEGGETLMVRQTAQDTNALSVNNENLVKRAAAKSTSNYLNSSWDLVDALRDTSVQLKEIADNELPEQMRTMTLHEREAYIKAKSEERNEIQKKIRFLYKEREAYVRKTSGELEKDDTLGNALMNVLEEQAEKKGYAINK